MFTNNNNNTNADNKKIETTSLFAASNSGTLFGKPVTSNTTSNPLFGGNTQANKNKNSLFGSKDNQSVTFGSLFGTKIQAVPTNLVPSNLQIPLTSKPLFTNPIENKGLFNQESKPLGISQSISPSSANNNVNKQISNPTNELKKSPIIGTNIQPNKPLQSQGVDKQKISLFGFNNPNTQKQTNTPFPPSFPSIFGGSSTPSTVLFAAKGSGPSLGLFGDKPVQSKGSAPTNPIQNTNGSIIQGSSSGLFSTKPPLGNLFNPPKNNQKQKQKKDNQIQKQAAQKSANISVPQTKINDEQTKQQKPSIFAGISFSESKPVNIQGKISHNPMLPQPSQHLTKEQKKQQKKTLQPMKSSIFGTINLKSPAQTESLQKTDGLFSSIPKTGQKEMTKGLFSFGTLKTEEKDKKPEPSKSISLDTLNQPKNLPLKLTETILIPSTVQKQKSELKQNSEPNPMTFSTIIQNKATQKNDSYPKQSKPIYSTFSKFKDQSPNQEKSHRKTVTTSQGTDINRQTISTQNRNNPLFTNKTNESSSIQSKPQSSGGKNRLIASIARPNQIINTQIVDYKMLISQQNKQSFTSFIVQYKERIIKSMQQYFTIRRQQYKNIQTQQQTNEKQIFLNDLTNLLCRNLSLDNSSFNILNHFIQKTFKQQKYDLRIFKQDKLNTEYFQKNYIYRANYQNSYCLNQQSLQLQLLIQKLQSKWYMQLHGYLIFLSKYTDLFRLPSDLFLYMFKYLLNIPNKIKQSRKKQDYRAQHEQYQFTIRKQLISLIDLYNKKLNSQYQMIRQLQLIEIIDLIENDYQHDDIVEIGLRVILNCIDFKKFKEFQIKVINHILGTKSLGLLPLRTIIHKITHKQLQYVPYYLDLYKYIKGQEWVDWLDTYLNQSKETHNLQPQQSEKIVECLCTLNEKTLKDRLLQSKKGISKFFNYLKEENLIYLYYKILQRCIYDQGSIRQIDQFYFKKMRFKLQYQEIITYITTFNQNLGHQDQSLEISFPILQTKLSILIKIMIIQPQSIKELENWIFADSNQSKKIKYNDQHNGNRQGQKILHLLIDMINIVSIKNQSTNIIGKIFQLLNKLTDSKDSQSLVLKVLRCNKPLFTFYEKFQTTETANSISQFLSSIVSSNHIYNLITFYDECKEEELKLQDCYLFRYNDTQYERIQKVNRQSNKKCNHFSIYWFHQLIKILTKQEFNPSLLTIIFNKLYIVPYCKAQNDGRIVYRDNRGQNNIKDKKMPIILVNLIEVLNNCSIWENISRILQYKLIRQSGQLKLINKYIQNEDNLAKKTIYYTLKLLKSLLNLYTLVLNNQNHAHDHWILTSLNSINAINSVRLTNYSLNYFNKGNNMLFSLFAIYNIDLKLHNDTLRTIQWQSQNTLNSTKHEVFINYINKYKQSIDLNVVQNHLTLANTKYYENEHNITTLCLDVLTLLINIYPELNIEFILTHYLPINKGEEVEKFKTDILDNFSKSLVRYLSDKHTQGIQYKIINFIYNLKCGKNKNNSNLSTILFRDCLNQKKMIDKVNPRIKKLIIQYLIQQSKSKSNPLYENYLQKYILSFLSNLQLKDNSLRNGYIFKEIKQVGKMLNNYKNKLYNLCNLNQLQRIIEERSIIEIGQLLETLYIIGQYFIYKIMNKHVSTTLTQCLRMFNAIAINYNIIFCQGDIPTQSYKYYKGQSSIAYNEEYPRMYIRDPVQYYISDSKNGDKLYRAQEYQKINIIQWFYDKIINLSGSVTKYFKLILSIHNYFYSNNPVSYTTDRNDLKNLDLFSHLALGKIGTTSIELFGSNNNMAVDLVQNLSQKIISRLNQIKNKFNEDVPEVQLLIFYQDKLVILVSCLEWLRNKQKYGQNALKKLINIIWKNIQLFMPNNHEHFFSSQAIKVLISSFSMITEPLDKKIIKKIHKTISNQLQRSLNMTNRIYIQQQGQQNINILTQLSITLLQLIPPQRNDQHLLQTIIEIWYKQSNYQYFFNQSRLMLRLCHQYPEVIVKMKPLLKCQILKNTNHDYVKYQEDERKFDGIAWLWLLKIANQLLKGKGAQSIFAITQINIFFQRHKQRILHILKITDFKISKAQIQELQLVLQLLISLFSHYLWGNINSPTIQQLTYILSHKTILLFIGLSQSNISFLINSRNEKMMSLVKPFNADDEDSIINLSYQNMHQLEMKLKINKCLRNYCILMKYAFKSSRYVEKYFDNYITDKNKYYTIFWQTFNKNLISLFGYANKQLKEWKSLSKYHDFMKLLNQCYNSPYTYVENGYLSSIIDIPNTINEVIEDIYLLTYVLSDLSVIHFMKQKVYILKQNKHLLSQLDIFSKKLRENLANVGKEIAQSNNNGGKYIIKEENFSRLMDYVEIRYVK